MTNDEKLMSEVLEFLSSRSLGAERLITALRERLTQTARQPVAWIDAFGNVFPLGAQRGPKHLNEPMKPLYTTPQPREWVSLTHDERDAWQDKHRLMIEHEVIQELDDLLRGKNT